MIGEILFECMVKVAKVLLKKVCVEWIFWNFFPNMLEIKFDQITWFRFLNEKNSFKTLFKLQSSFLIWNKQYSTSTIHCDEKSNNLAYSLHAAVNYTIFVDKHWISQFSLDSSDLSIFKHTSKTHCDSNNWSIWAQKVPKEA